MTFKRLLGVCALALPLFAQKPVNEVLTVDYVEVPVNVVDRAGNPVRGLTKANFEIYDGKKRMDVASFETIDFSSQESMLKNAKNPAAHRAFLLVFDLGYSSPKSLDRAQEAARAFVTKNVQRGDLVSIATIDQRSGYKLISNFTTDRPATLAAIASPRTFRAQDPLQLSGAPAWNKQQLDADSASHQNGHDRDVNELRQAISGMEENQQLEESRHRVKQQMAWLSQLAASLRNIRGRKQIVLLSEGFDPRLVSGRTAKDTNQENEEAASIIEGTWYMSATARQLDTDKRYGSNSTISTLQVLTQAFTGSDVTLNAIDIQGVRATQPDVVRGELVKSNDGLHMLAAPTGGTVFENSNDLSDNFARMLHQQEFVYILGFQSTVTNPGALHDLKVKLVDVPAGTRAIHRLGYFEGGSKQTTTERTLNAADVILRDIPQDAVHIASLAVPFPANGEKASVPVVLEISGNDLLANKAGNDIAAELFLYAFNEDGVVTDRIYDRLALDAEKSGEKLRANGVKYIAALSLPPGKYAIKSLVRIGGTEKMGFVRSDIDVPKAGETALMPPFVLDDPQGWLLVEGGRGMTYPFHVNGEPFVPSVTGRVPQGSVRKVAVFVENAQPEELKWETTPAATLLAQIKAADSTKLVLQLDPSTTNLGVTVQKQNLVMKATASIANR